MKYAVVLIFIIVFSGFNQGYTEHTNWITHITFNFSHANWVHLLLNSIAYIGVFRTLQKTKSVWNIFLNSLLISILCSFFVYYDTPVMGASGMIYAMIGMFFSEIFTGKLVIVNRNLFGTYIVSVIIAICISAINPHSAFMLHLLCLIFGFGINIEIMKKGTN